MGRDLSRSIDQTSSRQRLAFMERRALAEGGVINQLLAKYAPAR
jgi:hypothetical protein